MESLSGVGGFFKPLKEIRPPLAFRTPHSPCVREPTTTPKSPSAMRP